MAGAAMEKRLYLCLGRRNYRAMRKWATLLLLCGIAWPAMAAKTLSIEQMEQLLAKLHGKPDGKVAGELDDVQLTERMSLARLARWEQDLPGSKTREALMKLADLSAFLKPPRADEVPDPAPDAETQQRMLWLAVQYVKTTITRLPNFYATRETTHFEDTPSREMANATGASFLGAAANAVRTLEGVVSGTDYKALRATGAYSTTVTYHDGREVPEADAAKGKKDDSPALGLTTSGEFGPVLDVVMGDATRSEVVWLRWEQGASEPVGVFRYAVPEDQSNYAVRIPNGTKMEELHPAYHGEIAIDPATGAILRLSVVAGLPPPHETMQTAIVVEFAPVTIGDRSYICPVKGVAFSKTPVPSASVPAGDSPGPMQTQLNDVAFTHYHVFGSEARIVTDKSGKGEAGTDGAGAGSVPEAPGNRPQ
jgi:hypothetical protein